MPHPEIEILSRMPQPELERLYQRVFDNHDAKLVLEDLKARFWFYRPAPDIREVGQEDVMKHINNMINPLPEEVQHG